MVRLPDISLNDWIQDQQERFRTATDGLFPSLEFQIGTQTTESEIPPDFDAPGGMDQWQEVEKKNLEEQYRLQQEQAERQRQEQVQQQADQYTQMQAQSEQAAQQQAQQNESSVLDQIRGLGIPTPSEAFASFKAPGDNESSAALAGPPPSDVDQFNASASGMMTDAFGAPTPDPLAPDHQSSTGLLDQLGSAVSALPAKAASDIGSLVDRIRPRTGLAEGLGQIWSGEVADPEILNADPQIQAENAGLRDSLQPIGAAAKSATDSVESGLGLPEGTIYQAAQDTSGVLGPESMAVGMIQREGPQAGKLVDDAIAGIYSLRSWGLDDGAEAAERNLAQKTSLTIDEIRERVKNFDPFGNGGATNAANTVEEAAPTGLKAAEEAVDNLPADRGLTADEARQMKLPGFEDLLPETPPGEPNIRGFGVVPENMAPEVASEIRGQNAAASAVQTPLTAAERRAAVAEMIDADPAAVGPVLERAIGTDPKRAGIEQELLRTNAATIGEAWEQARQQVARVRQEIADHIANVDPDPKKVPTDLMNESAHRMAQFQALTNELSMAVKGTSLSAKAGSQILNAQRGGRLGAVAVGEARAVQDVAEAAGAAAEAVRKLLSKAGGAVDDSVLGPLRTVQNKLKEGTRARKAITGESDVAGELDAFSRASRRGGKSGGGKGSGGASGGAGLVPKRPESETLAERLGRLKREQTQLTDANAPESELNRVGYEIQEVLNQAREEASDIAQKRLAAKAARAETATPPTEEELNRIVNEAIGRRAISKIRREAVDEASGLRQPREAGKIGDAYDKALDRAIAKHAADSEKLQKSIDLQVQRRVDGMLAQEQRANVRNEVKEMAKQAQIWAGRIRKMPDQPGLEEEFDLILRRMSDHSNVGQRVADDLRERLGVNLSEDAFIRASNEERVATRAIDDARIRAVRQQIQDVLDNPQAPGRADRINQLYQDLSSINMDGLAKASDLRRKANMAGILKSGLFADQAQHAELAEMMLQIDPRRPETFKSIMNLMQRPNLWQVAREVSFINMLSSPVTHLTNITSTGANGALKMILRNPLEQIFSGGESSGAGAAFKGMASGTGAGVRNMKQAMRTGMNPQRLENTVASGELSHVGRELVPGYLQEQGAHLEKIGLRGASKVMGKMGEFLHMSSTRPLEAMDALMGNMMFSSEAARLAQQKADYWIKTGSKELAAVRDPSSPLPLREQAMKYIFDNIWDHPDIIKQAGKVEDYTLFRSRSPDKLEQAMRMALSLKEVGPNASTVDKIKAGVIDFIMPFYNVPYNFTKQGLGNVVAPLGAVGAAGKYAQGDKKGGAELMAKAVQGGLMLTIPSLLAMDDNITLTGPKDAGDRRIWAETHKPMSWRVPGTQQWVSYEGTPWAIPFATVAGAYEGVKYGKTDPNATDLDYYGNAAGGMASGAARGALSQAFLEGAVKNFEFLTGQSTGPDAVASSVAGIASRYSPNALVLPVGNGMWNFLAQVADTVERDPGRVQKISEMPQGIQDRIEQRIPGLRNELPVRRGAFGEEVPRTFPAPLYRGQAPGANDPLVQQLEEGGVGMPTVPRAITYKGATIPLTIAEQQRFQQVYGEEYRSQLERRGIGTRPTTDTQLEAIRKIARDKAQGIIMGELGVDEIRKRRRFDTPVEVTP